MATQENPLRETFVNNFNDNDLLTWKGLNFTKTQENDVKCLTKKTSNGHSSIFQWKRCAKRKVPLTVMWRYSKVLWTLNPQKVHSAIIGTLLSVEVTSSLHVYSIICRYDIKIWVCELAECSHPMRIEIVATMYNNIYV